MKAKIIIELDDNLCHDLLKDVGLNNFEELKGYLLGLWRAQIVQMDEEYQSSITIKCEVEGKQHE